MSTHRQKSRVAKEKPNNPETENPQMFSSEFVEHMRELYLAVEDGSHRTE
jgi:hypothetical protein